MTNSDKKRRQLPSISTIIIVLMGLTFVFFALFGDQGVIKLVKLYRLKNYLKKENEKIYRENVELTEEAKRLKDPEYLRETIRRELGYIQNDEVIYQIPEKTK